MNRNASKAACLAIALALPMLSSAWAQSVNDPWNPSPVGVCGKNFERGLMEARKQDAELVVSRVRTKTKSTQKKYVWIWDGTPSRNPDRMLYEVRGQRSCIILYMPFADTTDFKIGDDGSLPATVTSETQPLPDSLGGYASTVVTYRFDKKLRQYGKLPSSCRRKTGSGEIEIDCATAFE
ncbi:hypothetical protein ACS7SF_27525 (plasmid) [Ralstonia sp. 25C]|uniref:hypothetical protein n=1 Tax=Ralstonia sp. 25C TaxID=3447363 RepID=UPI003F74B170